ncbi:MAG: alpha,alpha-trehalase TreF [Saprospiraceae bacterium]|nr:alpha,alpha-trehalase TreF [Saprospiraceae bacterium]
MTPFRNQAFYEVLPDLFEEAHKQHLFPDGKVWADAIPKTSPEKIKTNYAAWQLTQTTPLKSFILDNFILPAGNTSSFKTEQKTSAEDHIKRLWSFLKRNPDQKIEGSSLIPLPHPYIVPGGRFNEIYYWDSYFTMLGLKVHGEVQLIQDMIDNFDWMIQNYGYIPNGNRTYFLGRSQPPFFSLMLALLAEIKGPHIWQFYLPSLVMEYRFWMDTQEPSHAVTLSDGNYLNRYMDTNALPRVEMYRDDVELASGSDDKAAFYQHIRAACESGWDFSSRWLLDSTNLSTIVTGDIIPVDLNCLLYALERCISGALVYSGKRDEADGFDALAERRMAMIKKWLWNEAQQGFNDYNYKLKAHTAVVSAACVYPLFAGIATEEQAYHVCRQVMEKLCKVGGIVSTVNHCGQQWDAPNGWAPLQWITCEGLSRYGFYAEAKEIALKWLSLNDAVFSRTGKMLEKYNVEDLSLEGGGGEYPVQDGFGWTNGVYVALKGKYGS